MAKMLWMRMAVLTLVVGVVVGKSIGGSDKPIDLNELLSMMSDFNLDNFELPKLAAAFENFQVGEFLPNFENLFDGQPIDFGQLNLPNFSVDNLDLSSAFDFLQDIDLDELGLSTFVDLPSALDDLNTRRLEVMEGLERSLGKMGSGTIQLGDFKLDVEKELDKLKSGKIEVGDFKFDASNFDLAETINEFTSKVKHDKLMKKIKSIFALGRKKQPKMKTLQDQN